MIMIPDQIFSKLDILSQTVADSKHNRNTFSHHTKILQEIAELFSADTVISRGARRISEKLCEDPMNIACIQFLIHFLKEDMRWLLEKQTGQPHIVTMNGVKSAPVFICRMAPHDTEGVNALKPRAVKLTPTNDVDNHSGEEKRVAYNNNNILGFLSYDMNLTVAENGSIFTIAIREVWVDERFMELGVPESLFSSLGNFLASYSSKILIDVQEDNRLAWNLLKKMGFRAVEVLHSSNTSQSGSYDQIRFVLTRRQFELLYGLE